MNTTERSSQVREPNEASSREGLGLHGLHLDTPRYRRTGIAEAIYGAGKTPAEIGEAALGLLAERARSGEDGFWPVLATRISEAMLAETVQFLDRRGQHLAINHDSEGFVAEFEPRRSVLTLGVVAVVAAGTTDRAAAKEAAFVLKAYGAEVLEIHDVGVAGLHRLMTPENLANLRRARAIVAVAGMEGALPGVVAGLVDAPVIGVPSPVGYGVSEGGHAALNTMLASCAPGLAVVNIGNGFGAAAMALKILRRAYGSRP